MSGGTLLRFGRRRKISVGSRRRLVGCGDGRHGLVERAGCIEPSLTVWPVGFASAHVAQAFDHLFRFVERDGECDRFDGFVLVGVGEHALFSVTVST